MNGDIYSDFDFAPADAASRSASASRTSCWCRTRRTTPKGDFALRRRQRSATSAAPRYTYAGIARDDAGAVRAGATPGDKAPLGAAAARRGAARAASAASSIAGRGTDVGTAERLAELGRTLRIR